MPIRLRPSSLCLAEGGHRRSMTGLLRSVLGIARELPEVVGALPRVEWWLRSMGPAPAAAKARLVGAGRPERPPEQRTALQRAIRGVDALLGPCSSCYRRALLEMALDLGAARDALMLGFRANVRP